MTPKELEILNQLNIRKVDLARVHFCKDNKVKYRAPAARPRGTVCWLVLGLACFVLVEGCAHYVS